MRTVKLILLVVSCSVFLNSCEKQIDLDLKESDQQIVVEGIVYDNLGDNFVALSKTRAYDDNGAIEKISNASVKITDNLGSVYSLYEIEPGIYTDSTLLGVAGMSYELNVNINGEIITATSVMNTRAEIDSISYEEETAFAEGDETEYRVYCHFKDSANFENFYRIKAFLGEEQKDGFINLSDEFFDGKSTFFPVFEVTYLEGEKATIQLLTVDELNFRYFTAVYSSQGGEVPGNPKSNLSGEKTVGYFGAYAKSEVTITVGL